MNVNKRKELLVTTIRGDKVPRKLTKRIIGEYYKIGDPTIKDSGDCYLVEGKYHRFNNELIEYDYEAGCYVLIHKTHLKSGIVDADENGIPIEGFFSANITKNVTLKYSDGKTQHCLSEDVAKLIKFKERYADGIFFDRNFKNTNWFTKIGRPPISKNSLPYDSRFATKINTEHYNKYFKPNETNIHLNTLGDFLEKNGITFGLEFETTQGYIPDRLCYKYGLIPLRDGSIEGLEYVTIPYSGRKGLYALKEVCLELSKRTKYNTNCALHLHVGGLTRDKESILSSLILAYLTQNDMYELQPAMKRGGMGIRDKDYCKPIEDSLYKSIIDLSNIDDKFKLLFKHVSDGVPFSDYSNDLKNVKSHPSDPNGTSKWRIKSRYKWINFVPIIFTNGKTLEFRHHSSTYEFENIINFLVLCSTFIYVAENYKNELLDTSSKFHKQLKSSTSNSLETYMLKCIDSNLHMKNVIDRTIKYNKERNKIMAILFAKKDYTGATESKYNYKLYSDLGNSNFWN